MAAAAADDGALPKSKVKKEQLRKAIAALRQVVAKRSANANPLFGSSAETMVVLFTLSTIPDKRKLKPKMIPLPHPMYDDKSEVCFFSKDPQKEYKELLLQKHPVPGLTKVIGIDKLRRNYKTLEAKRALADAFDLFICDGSIVEMMPKLLGNVFYKQKHKVPIPIRMYKDPTPFLKMAINGTAFRIPSGPCVGVKFGRCSMDEEQLVKNAMAVIAGVFKHVGATNPMQSIAVQATNAPALPIWRRPRPEGELLNLKKYYSDAASSAASETGASGASETEATADSEVPSDAGETLSTRDTLSEPDTAAGSLSELDVPSEQDSEAGDGDEAPAPAKADLPLLQGLRRKKRARDGGAAAAAAPAKEAAAPAASAMGPPAAKKAKKAKAGR